MPAEESGVGPDTHAGDAGKRFFLGARTGLPAPGLSLSPSHQPRVAKVERGYLRACLFPIGLPKPPFTKPIHEERV